MALFSRVHTWVSNEILTASDLNAEFNNLLTNAVGSSVIGSSANVSAMQASTDPGGVGTESLAASVADEIARLRFVIKRATAAAQWYAAPVSTLGTGGIPAAGLASDSVTTVKILDANVTTPKVADGAITPAKKAALGQQLSSSSGSFTNNTATVGSPADVTNLSVTITTTGRPVMLMLVADADTSNFAAISMTKSAGTNGAFITFLRGSTVISINAINAFDAAVFYPPSAYQYVDVTGAGTYTYKVQVALSGTGSSETINVTHVKLLAFEL
jgi:hypothetical protein